MSAGLIWVHSATGDLHADAVAAEGAALAQKWPEGAEGNRLMRAWLATQAAALASLGGQPVRPMAEGETFLRGMNIIGGGAPYVANIVPSDRNDNYDWQTHLMYALGATVSRGAMTPDELLPKGDKPTRIRTIDGEEPFFPPEATATAAIGVVAGVVIVLCAGIAAGAIGWIVGQENEVKALQIAQQGKTTQALAAMTSATKVLEQHQQREIEEQKQVPYSQEEMELFNTLQTTIRETAQWTPPPLRSVPNAAGVSEKIGMSTSLGTLALFGVGAYLLYLTSKR